MAISEKVGAQIKRALASADKSLSRALELYDAAPAKIKVEEQGDPGSFPVISGLMDEAREVKKLLPTVNDLNASNTELRLRRIVDTLSNLVEARWDRYRRAARNEIVVELASAETAVAAVRDLLKAAR